MRTIEDRATFVQLQVTNGLRCERITVSSCRTNRTLIDIGKRFAEDVAAKKGKAACVATLHTGLECVVGRVAPRFEHIESAERRVWIVDPEVWRLRRKRNWFVIVQERREACALRS